MSGNTKGIVLPIVIVIILILVITGMAILTLAEQDSILGAIEANKTKAFYLAEAGLAKMSEKMQKPIVENINEVLTETLENGSYRVEIDTNSFPCYAISTGISGTVQKKVRVQANFLAAPFEDAVYAANKSGAAYAFQLRGTGNPVRSGITEKGGKDQINGDIFVNGSAYLYEQSTVNQAPAPNTWNLHGDIDATGSVSVAGTATVAGSVNQHAEAPSSFSLTNMDYAHNNTYDVSQQFQNAGITSGNLPVGNALRDVFVKNPSDRTAQCNTTTGNDYFFEPSSGFVTGTPWTGDTPLHAGNNKIYYVDGDVWVSSNPTFGFKMDGKVTIVASGDIHICDNLQYKDSSSMLGLVALGKYNSSGNLVSGGNIYFGDAVYGNMSVFSAMMFAANNFLFNTDRTTGKSAEPDSGFTINGSFSAMNDVSINRDWYTKTTGMTSTPQPAIYDPVLGKWRDAGTNTPLNTTQVSTLRHYQMIINYDDRVRSKETRPPGLPRGGAKIFAGFSNWEEL
ncbi:MAG: hypothetical protein ABSH16_07830 [Sedimentisphaerales bacterium]